MHRITTNQEFLADIIEASVFGILVTDIDGSIEFVNSYCCDLFEYYSDELIGQSIQLLVPQYSQCYESIITALPSTKERRILQLEGIKKSGVKFPVELTISYISNESQDYIIIYLADITDQQQITDQNTLLSKIFQESLDGIYIINAETFRFELINSGATEQLGFTQEELQHVHPWDLQPNESRDTFLQRIEPLSTTKNQKITYEGLFERKDKSEFPVEIHLQRFAYDHRVVYMQMVIDISNRKKSEEAQLLQSEITKNLSEGIVLVQAENSSILYANALLHTMFGYPPGKLINESVSILIATTNRSPIETLSDIISELRTTGSWSGEIYNQHIDGSNFWCWLSISTFTHPAHGAVWVGVLSNIDERKRIEAELNREKQKAQMYLDVAGSIFLVLDKDRRVSLINQKGCEMLGYPEEEILGKDWFANFIPKAERQKVSSVFDQAMRGDISPHEHFVNRIVTRHQGERLIEWQNTVIHNEKGCPIAGLSSGIDITEKTLAEKAMTQALIEGQEIERKRIAKELHDGLGHSLTAIRLHLSALESDLQQFSNK
ncbi:MAG: PAS domain S-box protein, partial [Cyclobacteriaceae bacterium]